MGQLVIWFGRLTPDHHIKGAGGGLAGGVDCSVGDRGGAYTEC